MFLFRVSKVVEGTSLLYSDLGVLMVFHYHARSRFVHVVPVLRRGTSSIMALFLRGRYYSEEIGAATRSSRRTCF